MENHAVVWVLDRNMFLYCHLTLDLSRLLTAQQPLILSILQDKILSIGYSSCLQSSIIKKWFEKQFVEILAQSSKCSCFSFCRTTYFSQNNKRFEFKLIFWLRRSVDSKKKATWRHRVSVTRLLEKKHEIKFSNRYSLSFSFVGYIKLNSENLYFWNLRHSKVVVTKSV